MHTLYKYDAMNIISNHPPPCGSLPLPGDFHHLIPPSLSQSHDNEFPAPVDMHVIPVACGENPMDMLYIIASYCNDLDLRYVCLQSLPSPPNSSLVDGST